MLEEGEDFAGYRIEAVVGRGGMGSVYRALQQRPRRSVALKVIVNELSQDGEFRARFEREAELAAAIEHPNIIPVYEVGEHAGHLFIAMRFVDGPDVARLLADGPLTPERAVFITQRLASALGAAHEAGLVHRDVKPANVLVRRSGDGEELVYLTDFGLARPVTEHAGLTVSGQFLGTPAYAAPEQVRGLALDQRSDVYALGCVLHHMLTGQPPFPRKDATAVMLAHVNDPAPVPSAINPALSDGFDEVVAMALGKDPAWRFKTTGALGRAAAGALRASAGPLCPSCQRPLAPGARICAHCGESSPRPVVAPVVESEPSIATVPLHEPATTAAQVHPPTPEPESAPRGQDARRPGWPLAAGIALVAAIAVFAILTLGDDQDPGTGGQGTNLAARDGAASGDGAATPASSTDTPSPTATTSPSPTAEATPTETATPRPARTPTPARTAAVPVPAAPVNRTIAFHTGTDSGKALPAAYCRINRERLYCWTPNDGYTLALSSGVPTRVRGDEASNKRRLPEGYDRLGFGSTRARYGFRCTNRENGLSCVNTTGHGFTLPRYVGLPSIY